VAQMTHLVKVIEKPEINSSRGEERLEAHLSL
jgi:hypothetical protein